MAQPTLSRTFGRRSQPALLFEIPAGFRKFSPEALIKRIKQSDVGGRGVVAIISPVRREGQSRCTDSSSAVPLRAGGTEAMQMRIRTAKNADACIG